MEQHVREQHSSAWERVKVSDRKRARGRAWLQTALCVLTVAVFLALGVAVADSIRSAIEIGGDEHFEVTKAYLWLKGYPLYSRIWNDQPPVHTAILLLVFKLFGVGIAQARCVAAAFGVALFGVCFLLVRRELGVIAAVITVGCLLIAPSVFRLSIAAMLELPAIATSLWALWALPVEENSRKFLRLMAAGLIFGIALQIKMTAAVVAPGLLTHIFLHNRTEAPARWLKTSLKDLIILGAASTAAFLLIGTAAGIDYGQAWYSHFSNETTDASAVQEKALEPQIFLLHWEGICGAVLAFGLIAFRQKWRAAAVPVALLVSAVTIHAIHKPWWGYYYLHFAIPLAWLTAYATVLLYYSVWQRRQHLFSKVPLVCLAFASVLLCCIILNGFPRFFEEIDRIRSLPRIEDDPLVSTMRRYRAKTKFTFALNSTIYPFYAGIEVIPEIAVLPAKRFWSRQFSAQQVWVIVKEYNPEQIVLRRKTPPELTEFLSKNYKLIYEDADRRLYVANRIAE